MQVDRETRAIWHLIHEVNSIDAWRDRTGRRILALFMVTFAGAACLLFWAATHAETTVRPPGPRVPGVLHSATDPAR